MLPCLRSNAPPVYDQKIRMKTTIQAEQAGVRLDVFVAEQMPQFSRAMVQKLCEQDKVLVNGKPAKVAYKLRQGDRVEVTYEQAAIEPIDLPIVYEDDDVVVINKPAGVLTHSKGVFNSEFTVGEFMRARSSDGTDTNRPGIVHRLDRETSGVMIAAKTAEAKRWLQKQFATRKVKKTYLALVEGHPKDPIAMLDLPIERNLKKPQTFRVAPNGKPAQTLYETVKSYKDYTLLRLKPATGRTHQLRVHMIYLNCPIVGDKLYSKPNKALSRMFLHAAELELTLPSRERKVFTAPLPPELETFLKSLK